MCSSVPLLTLSSLQAPFLSTSYFGYTGEEVPLEIFKTNKKQCPILVVSYLGGVLALSALTL